MAKNKRRQKSSNLNFTSEKMPLPSTTIQSLQISLNKIENSFQELEDRKSILKHNLKIGKFSQMEKNLKNMLNIEYLTNFVNNKKLINSGIYKNLNLVTNIFDLSFNKNFTDTIAKKAICIYMDQMNPNNQS